MPGPPVAPLPDHGFFLLSPLQNFLCLGSGLAQHQLRLPLCLLPAVKPKLLRGDKCLVHCPLAIAEGTQLLLRTPKPLLVLGTIAQQPLQLFGDGLLELVDLGPGVAAQGAGELMRPPVERRQMERMIGAPASRSPNKMVPTRMIVAPSSTAIGKS